MTVLVLGLAMPTLLAHELSSIASLMTGSLRALDDASPARALTLLGESARHVFWTLLTLGSMVMVIGVVSALAQGGFALATKHAKPSFSKVNPLKGAKRLFGVQTLWEGAKVLLKSALVGRDRLPGHPRPGPARRRLRPGRHRPRRGQGSALGLMRSVALAGLVLAAADYAMQRRRVGKQTRMSKEDVKQEHKQSEGDPMLKGAIRSRQLAASRNRMMADVATADVVLVNPTHVAVALRYESAHGAPRVVARGAGAIAAKIRERAAEERVPMVRDVPLARALYSSTQVGQSIPPELFAAVASVLAFVISRRSMGQHGGEHRSPRSEADLPVVPAAGRRRKTSAPALAGR